MELTGNEILTSPSMLTDIEELEMNIVFTREHIKEIRKGGNIRWGENIVMSKTKYIEGASEFLRNQKALLKQLQEESK